MAAAKKTAKKAPQKKEKAAPDSAVKEKKGKAPKAKAPKVAAPEVREAAVAVSAPASREQAIDAFAASFNKDGLKRVATADQAPNTYMIRRPCGITRLDIDTGGGLPAGGMSLISGPDNAGKTFLLYKYMAMHQRIYGADASILFATVEGTFDFRRARNVGVYVPLPDELINQEETWRKLHGYPAFTSAEVKERKQCIGSFRILRGTSGEELLQMVLEACKKQLFNVIALDSLAMLLPKVDEAKEVGDAWKRGSRATLQTDFILKYTPLTSGLHGLNETTLIAINQVRANNDKANAPTYMQKYMKDWEAQGAYATKHGKLIDVSVWSGGAIKRTVNGVETTVGKEMKWELLKGKAGAHDNVKGATEFFYEEYHPAGTDDIGTILAEGYRLGCIVEDSQGVHVLRDGVPTGFGGPDMPTFYKMLAADFNFEMTIRQCVMAAAGIQCLYKR